MSSASTHKLDHVSSSSSSSSSSWSRSGSRPSSWAGLDPFRRLSLPSVASGWKGNSIDFDYWVPECDIEGEIPPDLNGTIFRNGPGIHEVYGTRLQHPIDGDGMVCALSFVDGRVHFRSKFVQSHHRREETYHRRFIYRGQMGTQPHHWIHDTAAALKSLVTGSPPKFNYRNPSNTNVFYFAGKLLSCYENGLPHSLDPYTLSTIGADRMNGVLRLKALAAHFRFDSIANRIVTMSLRPGLTRDTAPRLVDTNSPIDAGGPLIQFVEFDAKWHTIYNHTLMIPGLNYAHDFVLTPHYYIVHMTPFVKVSSWLLFRLAAGWDSPASQMKWYSDSPSCFVIIPRPTASRPIIDPSTIVTVKTDPMHIYHFGTAHELLLPNSTDDREEEAIEFNAVCLGEKFNMQFDHGVWLSNAFTAPGFLSSFRVNLRTRSVIRKLLDTASSEFPAVHPFRHGLPLRYTYLMAADLDKRPGEAIPYRDIVKVDALGERSVWHSYGCVCEPIFIPRSSSTALSGQEDDGWLYVQVYVPEHHVTHFVLLDAANIKKGPIAIIKLKSHITFGFHGTFTPHVFVKHPDRDSPVLSSSSSSSSSLSSASTTVEPVMPTPGTSGVTEVEDGVPSWILARM